MHKLHTVYILTLAVLSAAAGIASAWVIYRLDPTAGSGNIAVFYAITGAFVLALSTLILYFFRARFGLREMVKRHFFVSLRQGFWLALLYTSSLFLQSHGLFTWLNSAFLVIALTCLESYFLYNERKPLSD